MTTGRVIVDGVPKGIGFAVAPLLVLTAWHVIKDALDSDDSHRPGCSVQLEAEGGVTYDAAVTKLNREWDVAALTLSGEVPTWLSTEASLDGALWRVTSRPQDTDPALSGVVTTCSRLLATESGGEVSLIQLQVHESLGDFAGYSGSPVCFAAEPATAQVQAMGILVEQARWRIRPTGQRVAPVANVLFATPVDVAMSIMGLMPVRPPDVQLQKYRERMGRIARVESEADAELVEATKKEVIFRYVFGD